jgi:hypothetical protein
MDAEINAETLVSAYIAIRDKKKELEESTKAQIKELDENLQLVESALLAICKEVGADSIKTPDGIAMRSIKTKYTTNNWEAFYEMVHKHKAFELLERRIHQTHTKQFLEEFPDEHPAGLNIDRAYTITIRKGK